MQPSICPNCPAGNLALLKGCASQVDYKKANGVALSAILMFGISHLCSKDLRVLIDTHSTTLATNTQVENAPHRTFLFVLEHMNRSKD